MVADASLARGAMLCVVLYSGIALGAAGTSTSFASMTFHFAPKAVAPATVIRSTLCEGGSEGGMIGGARCQQRLAEVVLRAAILSPIR